MTDEPELSAADAERIRALLAEARVSSPTPDDVVGRLDEVLAGLRGDQVGTPVDDEQGARAAGEATVVPLRRRVASKLLPAAAAVIVLGGAAYGVTQLNHSSSNDSTTSAGSASGSASGRAAEGSAPESSGSAGSGAAAATPGKHLGAAEYKALVRGGVPTLSSVHLAQDARAVLVSGLAPADTLPAPDPSASAYGTARTADQACPGPLLPGTASEPALLDDTLVSFVAHPGTAAGRLVEVWSCDGSTRLDSVTVQMTPSTTKQ